MSEKRLKDLTDLGLTVPHGTANLTSRRDFLASGIIGLSTFAIVPSMLMNPTKVLAASQTTLGVGFLAFEGAGGMNIAGGNVMVGFGADEEQENYGAVSSMTDYILLGLPASMHPKNSGMINKDYGLVFHSTSGILAGMNSVLDDATKDSIDGIIICGRTADDSAENPINVAFQAQKAGARGKLVQLIGDTGTANGARSPTIATQVKSDLAASRITNFSEGSGLLSLGSNTLNPAFLDGSGVDGKGTARIQSFLRSISGLSKSKMDLMVNKQIDAAKIVGTQNTSKEVFKKFSPQALNPLNDAVLLQKIKDAFGTTGAMGAGNVLDEKVAAIANLVTEKIAGVGSIQVGGCDYHTGNSSTGNGRDLEIGRFIGKCIKLAKAKGENLFIHLYTDGGVGGDNAGTTDDTPAGQGRVNWVGDNGTTSSQMCLIYKHDHKKSIQGSLILPNKTRQVGYFRQGGGVNLTSTSVSNSTDQMWKAVILNYLACMSTESPDRIVDDIRAKFLATFPAETLPPDFDKLIRFRSIVS